MRIYFSAAHSCGKTTLTRYVSEKYNLPMISETARMILSEQELQIDRLRCDLNVANKYQKDVFNRQLIEEQKYNSFVSDRSLIDILAYTAQHTNMLSELINRPELTNYVNLLKSKDVFIFFVRPSHATLHDDNVREALNWDGIIAIDAMIKLLFQMFNLKYFIINSDNMQERIQFIDNILT